MTKEYIFCEECKILWNTTIYNECPLCRIKCKKVSRIFSDGEVLFADGSKEVFPMDHEGIKRYFGEGDIFISKVEIL